MRDISKTYCNQGLASITYYSINNPTEKLTNSWTNTSQKKIWMVNSYMKKNATTLVIREMQINPQSKTTTYPLEWVTLERWIISNAGKNVKQRTLIYCWWKSTMKIRWLIFISYKMKHTFTIWSRNPIPRHPPKINEYMSAQKLACRFYITFIHKSHKQQTTQFPIYW